MNEKKVQKFIMVFFMCTAGAVMLQLAAPMILGLIVNAVSIGIPFAGIHGAEGNESKRYLPIYLHMEKMNFGFVPMVSVISAPQRVTDGLAIFLDIRAHKPILLPNI